MPLTKITKFSLSQIISLVMLIVASLVAINIYQKQNKKIVQIRTIQDEQRDKNEILVRMGDLSKKFKLYKQRFEPKDNREIINTITNLAADTGIKIISLKPAGQLSAGMRKDRIFDKVFFNLNIQTDGYHELGKFISELENNPMIFIIESINISAPLSSETKSVGETMKLKVDLNISKLFYKD